MSLIKYIMYIFLFLIRYNILFRYIVLSGVPKMYLLIFVFIRLVLEKPNLKIEINILRILKIKIDTYLYTY